MKRLAMSATCLVLSLGVLTACGSGTSDYCDQIEQTQKELEGFGGSAPTSADFDKATEAINKIADKAPEDVKSEWEDVADALEDVQAAVEDAGLKIEDLQDPSKAQDVDPSQLKKITEAAQDMQKVAESQEKITKQVKEECDIDLGSA